MNKIRVILLLCLSLIFVKESGSISIQDVSVDQNGKELYSDIEMSGFIIKIKKSCQDSPDAIRALELMDQNLKEICQILSPEIVKKMQASPIWVEKDSDPAGAACYHPSRQWLVDNGKNPDKAACVEMLNYVHYVDWSERNQPYMVLHELVHLYHNQVLGRDNKDVADAYQKAKESGYYHNLWYMRNRGNYFKRDTAYAMNNDTEYLSEISEAYLGLNDYFPFDYYDLKEVDPTGFALMEKLWGKRTVEPIDYSGGVSVVPTQIVKDYDLDLYYRKYVDAAGVPVVGSRCVSSDALVKAASIISDIVKDAPNLVGQMQQKGVRVGLIGSDELLYDLPENRDLYDSDTEKTLLSARSYCATADRPLISCSEESVLESSCCSKSTCVNQLALEFTKSIYFSIIDPSNESVKDDLLSSYKSMNGKSSCSCADVSDYFAKGVLAYCDDSSRKGLKKSDKTLYNIVAEILN